MNYEFWTAFVPAAEVPQYLVSTPPLQLPHHKQLALSSNKQKGRENKVITFNNKHI